MKIIAKNTFKFLKILGHTARVGALAWNGDNLSSGSRDRLILQRDIRTPPLASERKLAGHRQEGMYYYILKVRYFQKTRQIIFCQFMANVLEFLKCSPKL